MKGALFLCRRHILLVSETHTYCVGDTCFLCRRHTYCVGDTYSSWIRLTFFYPSRPTCKMKTVCDRPFIKQPAFTAFSNPLFTHFTFLASAPMLHLVGHVPNYIHYHENVGSSQFDTTLFTFLASTPDIREWSVWPLYSNGKSYYRTIHRECP